MKNKKVILHVLNSNIFSGAENVVRTIIKNHKNKDYEFVYVSPDGQFKECLKSCKINFEPVKKLNKKELKRVLKKYNVKIIHAHDFRATVVVGSLNNNIKKITHWHNNPPFLKTINYKSLITYFFAKKFSKILIVSNSIKEEFIFSKKLLDKFIVVGNPTDGNKIKKLATNNKNTISYDLIFVGRLTYQKNPFLLIDIVKLLKNNFPYIKLGIVGSGEYEHDLKTEIIKQGLEKNIDMLGFQKNPYPFIENSKILILPSRYEGYGLVALESLVLGKPVVCSPVGGLVDIINDNNGKLCEDKEDFVKEVYRLLSNSNYYKKKVNYMLNNYYSYDNVKTYMKSIKKIYESFE